MLLVARLKTLLKKLFKGQELFQKGSGTLINNVSVEMRRGTPDKARCIFGNDSIISGNFVLETEKAHIQVGERTFIGGGTFVSAEKISIGSDVLISWGCTFIDTNAHPTDWEQRKEDVKDWKRSLEDGKIGVYKNWNNVISKEIKIGDKCWVGFNSVILKGVEIGEGSIIGAGSVVTSNVPPFTVYAGNPAQLVKSLR